MKEIDQARELASTMVALGTDAGVTTRALLTDMSTPLGRTAGNALEVAESLEVLAGGDRPTSSTSPWPWPWRCAPPPADPSRRTRPVPPWPTDAPWTSGAT